MLHFRLIILVLIFAGIIPRSLYAIEQRSASGWIRATTNAEVPYFKAADPSSGILGYFSARAEITISPVPKNDYFLVFFSVPVNGANYAYVPADAIDVDSSLLESAQKKKEWSSGDRYPFYFVFEGVLSQIHPSDIQSKLGESPYYFLNLDYIAEFGMRVVSIVDLNFQVRSNSFEHGVQGYSSPVNYTITGLSTMLGLQLHIFRVGPFSFLASAGAGYSFNSAGNNSQFFKMNTEGLMGYPAYWQARFQYLFGRVGINADFGYLYHTVQNVPILTLPIGATQSTANIDMSSYYGALGVNLHF